MAPTVQRWSNVHDFLAAARPFLSAREAEHCLLLGLTATMERHPDVYADPRFWTVHADDRVIGAALRTPPHNLILSMLDEPRGLAALIDDVLASDAVPGVLGPTGAARALADAWSARTGRAAVRLAQERIFRLDRVIAPRPAAGRYRAAEERDRATLAAWLAAFFAEATPAMPAPDAAALADQYLRQVGRTAHVWEAAGEVVALAGTGGPTPRGIRVGPVYTPPAHRGRGYASNLVAEVSARALAAGRSFCFLFTDLANPTSNHIYQMIGYAPVVDVDQYRFPDGA
ncbi:MAG TPA: GNAT family N-acetyltransferase [Kofleriaceae bacterium]|nr:GNAT family N-acetyltransferase [Kofleriaceae bacterium]